MEKRRKTLVAVIAILILLISIDAFAQIGINRRGSGGWSMGTQYDGVYDQKTLETIYGDVVAIELATPDGMSYGVHLLVKTEKEIIPVHLGPTWYIENQDIKIDPNSKVEVRGSRIIFEGKPAIIAVEVKKGDEMILKLRDENGVPVWSGWRRF